MDQGMTVTNGYKISFKTKKQAEDFADAYRGFVQLLSSIIENCILLFVAIRHGNILEALKSLILLALSLTVMFLSIAFLVIVFIGALFYYYVVAKIKQIRPSRSKAEKVDEQPINTTNGVNQTDTDNNSMKRNFCFITNEGIQTVTE